MVAIIERAAAMREPTHDEPVPADHLQAIDAEVLPGLRRAARHGESPGDERAGVARPARLHRQASEIDVSAFPHDFLAWSARALARIHVQHLLEQRKLVPQVA